MQALVDWAFYWFHLTRSLTLLIAMKQAKEKKSRCNDFQSVWQNRGRIGDSFPVQPVIAYRRHASLRDLLVHSTLRSNTPHTQQPAGVYKCNHPRCLTCPFLQEGQQITFLPQLMNKEKSLTTYSANQKILST